MAVAKNKPAAQPAPGRGPMEKPDQAGAGEIFGKEEELKAYRDMLLIRRFEERAGQMYGMGLIGGFCHLYIGQEAVVVGMQMALKEGDQVITAYRDHGHMLACGMDPKGVMAELTGRRGGYSKGKGGSMHMFSARRISTAATASSARRCRSAPGSPSPTAIAATTTSADLFRRRRGQPGPGLRKLQHGRAVEAAGRLRHREQPLCAWARRSARASATHRSFQRGVAFGIPGEQVDGMDVARGARRRPQRGRVRAATGKGPIHPRDADLPLSRPFDVRPGQVSHARGGAADARPSTIRSNRCASASSRADGRAKTSCKQIDGERPRRSSTRRPSTPGMTPSRIRPSCGPMCWSKPDGDQPMTLPHQWPARCEPAGSSRSDMPTEVLMPALSPTMEEGKIAQWVKNEGDTVKAGDVIAEIETDKATMEVEAVDEGMLGEDRDSRGHRRTSRSIPRSR